jgi:phosphopentomutase
MRRLGLGCVHDIEGVAEVERPRALYGRMREASPGKDTTTGHWEIAGLVLSRPFAVFPDGFPVALIDELERLTGRRTLGNVAASGTEIIERLGLEHQRTGRPIVYTSADSVFQIAAHERVVPPEELYRICGAARELCDAHRVARVIARPFVGEPGSYRRTHGRRDLSMPPPAPTALDRLLDAGIDVTGVGKIEDIFAGRGLSASVHSEGNEDGMRRMLEVLRADVRGLVFANLVDFDMLYGHRNDPAGYARALEAVDRFLPELERELGMDDVVVLTADHGCDPTWRGTDHTREHVPLLVFGPRVAGGDLGVRETFADVAETVLSFFGLPPMGAGVAVELPPARSVRS